MPIDISLTAGDQAIVQEQARGNIGTLTDICIDDEDEVVQNVPAITGGGEVGFGYAG